MWMILYKIFFNILLPPGIFIILFFAAALIVKRGTKRGKSKLYLLFVVSALVFYMMSISPIVSMLSYPLEKGSSAIDDSELEKIDSIVVLGAGLNKRADGEAELSLDAKSRVLEGLRIYNKSGKKIIVTGGDPYNKGVSEAETAKNYLMELGVKEKDILTEEQSLNTYENGKFTKELLDREKFKMPVIVTSAIHMKRAEMSFKIAGANFKKSVSDRMYSKGLRVDSFFPSGENIDRTKQILWEYIGLLYYSFKR